MRFETLDGFTTSVCERLSLPPTSETLGVGDDGLAIRLGDGRVLKITCSPSEAGAMLAVQAAQSDTTGFPKVDLVAFTTDTPPGFSGGVYLVVREDALDFDQSFFSPSWWRALDTLGQDPSKADMKVQARSLTLMAPQEIIAFKQITSSLKVLKDRCGITDVWDVGGDNLGITASGEIVVRDLSRCTPPSWARDDVVANRLTQVPPLPLTLSNPII